VNATKTIIRSLVFALLIAAAPNALAQGAASQGGANKGQPNALQGFSENRSAPVQIEAASLEVRDKEKKATFSGNVKVVQGDTTMLCKSLVVYYEQDAPGTGTTKTGTATMKAAQPGPGGSQQISRLDAFGGVKVTQKDQVATGDTAHFDMRGNTVTLTGNVTVIQGKNVMKGDRLVVDMTSGVSRVEGKGPVSVLIDQESKSPGTSPAGSPPAANSAGGGANASAPGARQSPFAPPKLGPRPFPSN
jgi:lipopolysaccharide export system protein LptA